MAKSILVDTGKMKIIAASDQPNAVKCCAVLADILLPEKDYLILGITTKWFKKSFSIEEQKELYQNTTGEELKKVMPENLLYHLERVATSFEVDNRSSEQLVKALGRPFASSAKPMPEKRKKGGALPSSTPRPRQGTASALIWEICEKLEIKLGTVPSKQEVIDDPMLEGINPNTVGTQYSRWKGSK